MQCVVSCLDVDTGLISSFMIDFNKTYGTEQEEVLRTLIFRHNFELMQAHNSLYDEGKVGWRMGINEDFDWTNQEQDEWHGGVLLDSRNPKESETNDEVGRPTLKDVPDSWSWVEQGGVTQIKNQVQIFFLLKI